MPRVAERAEGLQHADALDVVDDDAVQPAQFIPVALEGLDRGATKRRQEEQDQQQGRQRHQGELPVDEQHDDAD